MRRLLALFFFIALLPLGAEAVPIVAVPVALGPGGGNVEISVIPPTSHETYEPHSVSGVFNVAIASLFFSTTGDVQIASATFAPGVAACNPLSSFGGFPASSGSMSIDCATEENSLKVETLLLTLGITGNGGTVELDVGTVVVGDTDDPDIGENFAFFPQSGTLVVIPTPVPEPAGAALVTVGLLGLGYLGRRRR